MIYKRMIVASVAAFAVGAAGFSMFSHAQDDVAPAEQADQAEQAQQADQPEQAEQPGQFTLEPEAAADIEQDDVSYALGYRVGSDFAQRQIELDVEQFTEGFAAALGGDEPRMSEQELMQALFMFQMQMQARQQEAAEQSAEISRQFLEQNRQEEGVQVTESGLQYRIIEEGEGDSPQLNDVVTVHYRGTLVDGEVFDSSYERGQPAQFPVDGVIPGWTEALQMMRPGAKWELYVPAELAYGEQGGGNVIPPNAALIFEVELLEVNDGN